MATFGEAYKSWRKSKPGKKKGKCLSNYTVSATSGVSRSNLTHMEKGEYYPSDDVLEKLAKVPELEITFAQLKQWQMEDPKYMEKCVSDAKYLPTEAKLEIAETLPGQSILQLAIEKCGKDAVHNLFVDQDKKRGLK